MLKLQTSYTATATSGICGVWDKKINLIVGFSIIYFYLYGHFNININYDEHVTFLQIDLPSKICWHVIHFVKHVYYSGLSGGKRHINVVLM